MSTADVTTDWLVAECKHRQTLPAWLKAALVQAVNAADSSQLPICVLHESGQRHTDDLVLMRLGDFIDHFGPLDDGLDGGKTAG